ncbi:hypothetical protein ACU686_25865 [Yinghuangia aomiensis]
MITNDLPGLSQDKEKNQKYAHLKNDPHIGDANYFYCREGDRLAHVSTVQADHRHPVADHWNNTGSKTTQPPRVAWYNNLANLELMCGLQRKQGSGGIEYEPDVGDHFLGPKNK